MHFRKFAGYQNQAVKWFNGVPIERPFMVLLFKLMACNIRDPHFSTEKDVSRTAHNVLDRVKLAPMLGTPSMVGPVYEVGHFAKR